MRRPRPPAGPSRREVLALLGMGVLAACSGDDDEAAPSTTTTSSTTTSTTRPPATTTTTAPAGLTVVARAEVDVIEVFDSEDGTEPARTLDRREETTGNLVFVVEQQAQAPDGRHLLQLPVRPNGSTGWVRATDVSLSSHQYRIEVELGAHVLRLRHGDDVVTEVPIGVGTTDTPTPGGTYYIKELLQPPDPGGPYGAYAYGLSGFSNVFETFGGGDGVIGIHGTNRPDLVGTDVSAGCIRVTNDVITRFVEEIGLPLGVPVDIRA